MEKRDELWTRGPCFYYDTALFPPGTDSFCLAYFARPSRGDTVCDLGSGIGLLGTLLLARQESPWEIAPTGQASAQAPQLTQAELI